MKDLIKRRGATRRVPNQFACYFGLGKISLELISVGDVFMVQLWVNSKATLFDKTCLTMNEALFQFNQLVNTYLLYDDDRSSDVSVWNK